MQISGIEENVLIKRMISGDQTAFELLFTYYYPGLVVFVSQMIQDSNEAEEVVQDFFVRLWIKKENVSTRHSFKNYLFTSVKNSSLNYLKHIKIKEKIVSDLQKIMQENLLYNPDIYIETELQQQLKKAYEKLPPRTLEVFKLSRLNGLQNNEIALKLDISKRTVETQISKALKILRLELKDYLTLLLLF